MKTILLIGLGRFGRHIRHRQLAGAGLIGNRLVKNGAAAI